MEALERIVMLQNNFYKNKTVLITGHTGFKGSWLSEILLMLGAKVIGYSLPPSTSPNLFDLLKLEKRMTSIIGDVRDLKHLDSVFSTYKPEIVFHLAAQPIVRISYQNPVMTYETNVMGTVNICECVRTHSSVKSFINITTDKVYENNDIPNHPFLEDEKLDGYDPYSNSKSCSEIITHSYFRCFFAKAEIAVSTARAGNVIGGGDFSPDRIIPDCVRALEKGAPLIIRNPNSTRPYQHVLDPLYCYLEIAEKQWGNHALSGAYNIGPDSCDFVSTITLVELFKSHFNKTFSFEVKPDGGPHEASFLSLDNAKTKRTFLWTPRFHIREAVSLSAEWYDVYRKNEDIRPITDKQIREFFKL